MPARPAPARSPIFGLLCVVVGVAMLVVAALSSVLFVRGAIDRGRYARAAACLAEPVSDCWVEVTATVIGKRVDARSIFVDDHILELNEVGGPEVTLADGSGLWSALEPGEPVTLRLWRGDFVHASAKGHEADTVDNPRVRTQRLYAASLVALGLGGILVVTGFGRLGVQHRAARTRRHPAFRWAGRFALAAVFAGTAGLATEVYTRVAPLPVVTLLGVGVLAAVAGVIRLARARSVRQHATA